MQVVDLLHADIDTGLSRIDTSISSFEVLTQSIPSESSTQGLQRIERHLQNLLEETDFNLKKVYNDRKRLINLNYNNWSMDHVHQFDKITKQFFHMKDVLRQLSDRIANNSVKPFSKAIKEEDVKVECAPSSPQDAIIESPTTTSRKRGETRTDQTVKKIINALPATQSDARPAQKHAHLATSLNANVKVRTGLLPVPCKSEDPPTPQENSYKKRKTAKETPTTTTETRKFSCDTEQPIGESGRRSDSPSRKKSREALKPVSIPTERIPNHQTPSVSEVRTDVFDPRSKSYHIWKQATTSHNDAFRGVPLRSYTIPKEWDKFERDFRKHSDSLVRDFIAKHASPVKTTDEVNVGQSDAAATKTETAVASETMETPVPINSTAQHNDATSVQPIIRTERHTVSEPSSSSCKPQIAARKQSHKENISEKTIEDDDSDIEVIDVIIKNVLRAPLESKSSKPVLVEIEDEKPSVKQPIVKTPSINSGEKLEVRADVEITSCSQMSSLINAGLITLTSQYPPNKCNPKEERKSDPLNTKPIPTESVLRYETYREYYEKVLPKTSRGFKREKNGLRLVLTGKVLSCTLICGKRHYPYVCPRFPDGEAKRKRCLLAKLCLICLMPETSHSVFCHEMPPCPICKGVDHHVVVCTAQKCS